MINKEILDILLVSRILDDEIPKRVLPSLVELYLKFNTNDYIKIYSNMDENVSLSYEYLDNICINKNDEYETCLLSFLPIINNCLKENIVIKVDFFYINNEFKIRKIINSINIIFSNKNSIFIDATSFHGLTIGNEADKNIRGFIRHDKDKFKDTVAKFI